MTDFVARSQGLVVEELDDGVVVYDTDCGQAHWLDGNATAVWRACASASDSDAIASRTTLDRSQVTVILDHLTSIGLIEDAAGCSRRTVLVKAAKIGAAGAVAAPIISAVVPIAAAHASTTQSSGNGGNSGGGSAPYELNGTFYVPAGYTVTFTNEVVNGCDPNTVGYTLNGGAFQALLFNNSDGYYCRTATGGGQTIGPFASDQQLLLDMQTTAVYCAGKPTYDYYSNNPNHSLVTTAGTNSWTVYFSDDKAACCGPNCPSPPTTASYNGRVTVTISQ